MNEDTEDEEQPLPNLYSCWEEDGHVVRVPYIGDWSEDSDE